MPRPGRIVLANGPHHVIQRGHNKQTVFHTADESAAYMRSLGEWKRAVGRQNYAYRLMTNHVHLIMALAAKRVGRWVESRGRGRPRKANK